MKKLADNERYLNGAQPWLGTVFLDKHGFPLVPQPAKATAKGK